MTLNKWHQYTCSWNYIISYNYIISLIRVTPPPPNNVPNRHDAYNSYKTLIQTPTLLTSSCIIITPVFWMLSQILHCPPKGESVCQGRWVWCSVDWSTAVSLRPSCGTAWPRVGGENVACHCYSAYAGLSGRWRWWFSICRL